MKLIQFTIATVMVLLTLTSAFAFNFSVNGTNVTTGSPTLNLGLNAWNTVYHLNSNPAGRNSIYPTYEYQFDGERVHFSAIISSNNVFATEGATVEAIMQCPTAGNQTALLSITSPSQYVSGSYLAEYQGDWIIPPSTVVSENCPISVRVTYGTTTFTDPLNDPLYSEVNDILANPPIIFGESAPINYPNPIFNSVNNANPYPQTVTIASGDLDREGQGFLGTTYKYVHELCGSTFGDCIAPSSQQVSLDGTPSSWISVTDLSIGTGRVGLGPFIANGMHTYNLYWQLNMPGNVAPDSYSGMADNYLLEIY